MAVVWHKILIGMHNVSIGGNCIDALAPTALGLNRCHPVAQRMDMHHRIAQPHRAAETLEMLNHASNQPVGAALGPPHAAVLLQLVDQRVDRTGFHRIAADKERMEAERLAQLLVLDIARDHRIDRAPSLITHKGRRSLDHRGKIEERHRAELDISLLKYAGRKLQELGIARHVARVKFGDLGVKARFVVRVVEVCPVRPIEPVEWRNRHKFHVLLDAVARQRPELLKARRIGHHGRPGIESETVLFPIVGPPAGLVSRLDNGCLDARRLETNGQSQPAETGTDYACFLHDNSGFPVNWSGAGCLPSLVRTPSARLIGTGGIPARIRNLSKGVDRPE